MATGTAHSPVTVTEDPSLQLDRQQLDRQPWWHGPPDTLSNDDFGFLLTQVVHWRLRAHAAEAALADLRAVTGD